VSVVAGALEEKHRWFLRTAHKVALNGGDPTSRVHGARVAQKLGLDTVENEDHAVEFTGMARYLHDADHITDWTVSEDSFRLTSKGIEEAEGP
jgi:hypothetical protein